MVELQDTKLIFKLYIAFPYINNKISEKEVKKTISLLLLQKKKMPSINLTKEVNNLYIKNDKTLIKEIEDTQNMDSGVIEKWVQR